jgi:hypothetical protein
MIARTSLAVLAVLMSVSGGQAQAFKDLPGVVPSDATEEYSDKNPVVCELQVEVPPSSSNSRWMPRNVYVCKQNGVTFSGTRTPLSRERSLRGMTW